MSLFLQVATDLMQFISNGVNAPFLTSATIKGNEAINNLFRLFLGHKVAILLNAIIEFRKAFKPRIILKHPDHCQDHRLMFNPFPTEQDVTSHMVFDSLQTARDLFDGNVNAIAAVGMGQVRIGGMVSQVDNINRILDRVAVYLA